ncbi:MAG: hypothetical protein QJR13_03915 [Bacillota bacterium]|nr:hypothetical protein [Bacillota bacterium]
MSEKYGRPALSTVYLWRKARRKAVLTLLLLLLVAWGWNRLARGLFAHWPPEQEALFSPALAPQVEAELEGYLTSPLPVPAAEEAEGSLDDLTAVRSFLARERVDRARPVLPPRPEAAAGEGTGAVALPPPYRVVGMGYRGSTIYAIISVRGGAGRVVALGDHLDDGWTVAALTPEGVTVKKGEREWFIRWEGEKNGR